MKKELKKKVESYLASLYTQGLHLTISEIQEGIQLLLEIELDKDLNSRKSIKLNVKEG